MSLTSIELFVGAGGLGLGTHHAGFSPALVVERDRWCCDTIRENAKRDTSEVKDWPLIEGDVRTVSYTEHEGKIDLVSGGPPCQPFSIGGKHKAAADARDMFPEAVRAVRETRPRAFLFENVKGLTRQTFNRYFEYVRLQMTYPEITAKDGEDWHDHLARLERHHTVGPQSGLIYQVVTRLMNAADYGVPQRRERVFFVGFRSDLGIDWSFPEPTHSADALVWSMVKNTTSSSYWGKRDVPRPSSGDFIERIRARARTIKKRPETLAWRTVRDAIGDLPDPEKHPELAASWHNHRHQPGARSYTGHTGSPMDWPAKTIKAGVHGVPGGENMLSRIDGTVRYLTVRESARIQTFPDDFVFHGAWGETMRQLGNAVPVDLATVVARAIRNRLDQATSDERTVQPTGQDGVGEERCEGDARDQASASV